jgi:hypothetical protein
MNSDVSLDNPFDTWVSIDGAVLKAGTADLMLDSPVRRGPGGGRWRRALVHGSATAISGDNLIVNFNGDYPGGVRVNGADLNLKTINQRTADPKLPKVAALGDLRFIRTQVPVVGVPHTSLWLCTGHSEFGGVAEWSPVSFGEAVVGTE